MAINFTADSEEAFLNSWFYKLWNKLPGCWHYHWMVIDERADREFKILYLTLPFLQRKFECFKVMTYMSWRVE